MWNRTEDQIKLVMIRHGETDANKEHRYLGRTDEPLCEQAKENLYARVNCYPKIDILFTSPMKRCIETAGIMNRFGSMISGRWTLVRLRERIIRI